MWTWIAGIECVEQLTLVPFAPRIFASTISRAMLPDWSSANTSNCTNYFRSR